MKFIQSFNENSNNLTSNLDRILEITSYRDQSLKYWLEYADDSKNYENIQDLSRSCKKIVEEFEEEYEDVTGTQTKNRNVLIDEMFVLGKFFILLRGSVNRGILQAYCSQNMESVEWAKSDSLRDLNRKTGIFESLDYFEHNEECSLSKLRTDISEDHVLYVEKMNEYLKQYNFEAKFVELINGKLGGHYIHITINNIHMVVEGWDHLKPYMNSSSIRDVFKSSSETYFYTLKDFIEFYKLHNLHLYDMNIAKTGIFDK